MASRTDHLTPPPGCPSYAAEADRFRHDAAAAEKAARDQVAKRKQVRMLPHLRSCEVVPCRCMRWGICATHLVRAPLQALLIAVRQKHSQDEALRLARRDAEVAQENAFLEYLHKGPSAGKTLSASGYDIITLAIHSSPRGQAVVSRVTLAALALAA